MLKLLKEAYLQRPTKHSMTMMWETSEPANSRVDILQAERIHSGYQGNYKPPQHVIQTSKSEAYSTIHEVTVDGLEPSTVYFYTIHSANEQGEISSGPFPFKTAIIQLG